LDAFKIHFTFFCEPNSWMQNHLKRKRQIRIILDDHSFSFNEEVTCPKEY